MRIILGVALAAGLAGSAAAQTESTAMLEPPPIVGIAANQGHLATAGEGVIISGYDRRLSLLKKKVDQQTRKDGGQLTPEHEASLQKELDDLNQAYRPARQASR